MAISFVAAGAVGTGANPTAALPAGISTGDFLIITTTGTATPTTPSGWTQRFAQGTGRFLTVLTKVATASESNVTLTLAGTTSKVVMVAYSGVGGINALGTVNTGNGTSASTTTFTTTIANDYVISLYSRVNNATSTFTTPTGTTSRVNSSSSSTINGLLLVDELDAVAGVTTSRTTILSNGDNWATYAFALAPTENRYWVGGTGDWDSTTKWSASSGGASGASVPTSFDKVFIDTSSGTGTITAQTTSKSMEEFTVTATQAIELSIANVTFFVRTATTLPSSGSFTITDSGTSNFSANGTLTSNSITFPSITVGTCTLGSNLTVMGRLQHTSGTFDTSSVGNYSVTAGSYYNTGTTTRALNLNASTLTFTSPYVNGANNAFYIQSNTGFTFTSGTSTINLSNAANGIETPALTFYNVAFTSSDPTSVLIRAANTYNNLTFTSKSSVGICSINILANQVINGVLTLGAANVANKRFYLVGNAVRTITVATVATLSDVDFRNITVAGASSPWSGTRLGNALGNTNITFGAGKTVYWNLAGTQNWSDTGWATTNNGTPALNNFPLAQDTAVFTEAGSAGAITWDAAWNVGTIQMADGVSNRTTAFTLAGSSTFTVYGSITLFSSLNLTATSTWAFYGAGVTQDINFAGVTMPGYFVTINTGGTVRLLNNLISSNSASRSFLSNGTFDANGYNVTCFGISDNSSSGSTITVGSGTWTLTGTGTIWETEFASVNAGTSTIILSDTTTTAREFRGGSKTYGNLTIGGATGTSTLTITGANTFSALASTKTVAHTITFGGDQTIGTWSVTGTVGNVVTVNSSVAGTQRNIGITNKTTTIDYLAVQDINGANINPITFWAGANSTNNGNNNDVIFASGALNEAYIITSGTSWTVPANFNSGLNAIYLFGGGGGGAGSSHAATLYRAGGGGGGGGAYTRLSNAPLTPTSSYTIAIGAAGAGGVGSTTGNSGGNGGQTTLIISGTTYRANGGTGGSATSSGSATSTGGTGGTAQSVSGLITAATAGGTGGAGSTSSTTNNHSSGGGGAGAGGPNGTGANGGTGTTSSSSGSIASGGGGGNGGGTAGGNAVTSTPGVGGNNSLGVGGGAAATSGFSGGGGGGGVANALPGNGGSGNDISAAFGSGGGTGGRSFNGNNTSAAGLYGAGGGGAGGVGTSSPVTYNGGAGAQGAIIFVYALPLVFNDTVTESSTLADVVSAVRTSNDTIVENTTLEDIQIPPATFNLDVVESLSVTDRSNTSEFEENTDMADSSSAAIIYNESVNESISVEDSVTCQGTFNSITQESITVADFTVGYGWFEINDTQAVTWTPINNFQPNNI